MSQVDDMALLGDIRRKLMEKPVRDYTVSPDLTLCDFIEALGEAHGFMAGHVYEAAMVLADMWMDEKATRFLAFTANLVATGLRGVIAQLVREGFAHAIITTCGTVDHDIARGTGHKYYRGYFALDDTMLRTIDMHRLGNVVIPVENYGLAVENFTRRLLERISGSKKEWRVAELLREAGAMIEDKLSILRAAYEKNVPVFVPGITDGAFGTNLALQAQFHGLKIDVLGDERALADIVFGSEKLGALIIGGGISKHHTIWWAQFRDGLDYAVYLTTAVEYDGSLSGAQPREAISWGKLKPTARSVVVYGDATITLPLVVAGAKCFMRRRK